MEKLTKKDHKQNLVLNIFHEYFWGFGLAFHTVYAIVPLFLKSLGAPNGVVISVAGLFSILVALPQFDVVGEPPNQAARAAKRDCFVTERGTSLSQARERRRLNAEARATC